MDNDELFELVRRKYAEANKEYIQEQIRVASECLTDEQLDAVEGYKEYIHHATPEPEEVSEK